MSEEDRRRISEVTRKSGAFGDSFVVTVDDVRKKFKSEEEATAYRDDWLAQQDQQKRIQERQAEEARLRAEFGCRPGVFCRSN